MEYKPVKATPAARGPAATRSQAAPTSAAKPAARPTGPLPPVRLSAQAIEAAQARKQAVNPNDPQDPAVQEQARQLQKILGSLSVQKPTTGSPATPVFGLENAANLHLGSSRKLVTNGGMWKGLHYASLDEHMKEVQDALKKLKAGGNLGAVMQAYEKLYGTSVTAVLGEQVRNPLERQKLLTLLPAPMREAQLTRDAFIEQLAVRYVYQNTSADALNKSTDDGRRASSPKDILNTFGYRAGPPVAGKWGFQMRVFLPLKAGLPPIVAFRGTEGISFDMKSEPEGTLDTIVGDFAPAGVGYNQYRANHALIKRNMDAAATHGHLIITGHSLGGALAQIAATEFRAVTRECVTFQAANIDQQDVNKVKNYNKANPKNPLKSTHYRIDGDVVPNAGQAALPGEIHYFDRVVRPKGSTAPFKLDLKADTLDVTRAQGGHISPMLSTYLRGQKAQNQQQTTLQQKGLRDESTLGKNAQDVQMVYGGKYGTEKDPRIELESRRTTTLVGAMKLGNLYENVYYDQIAYNTLLAKVEGLVASGKYKSLKEFVGAAQKVIEPLRKGGRLPLGAQDKQLGTQLKLKLTQKFSERPSPYGEMIEAGVPITRAAINRVTAELETIWTSWHPEVKK